MEFEVVLEEYRKLMWHVINDFVKTSNIPHSHTDDIFQEASIRLYNKLKTYEPSKSSMKTFVTSNTEIVCMRYRREFFKNQTMELDEDSASQESSFAEVVRIVEDYGTSRFNKKIIYQKLYGYTQQEIAKDFGISQSTVSRILNEFRDYLAVEMKK